MQRLMTLTNLDDIQIEINKYCYINKGREKEGNNKRKKEGKKERKKGKEKKKEKGQKEAKNEREKERKKPFQPVSFFPPDINVKYLDIIWPYVHTLDHVRYESDYLVEYSEAYVTGTQ